MTNTETLLPTITLGTRDFTRLDHLAAAVETKLPAVAAFLGRELERARVVPERELGPDVVTMGAGRMSVLTPVGAALIGLSAGQSIQWRTRADEGRTLRVLKVTQPGLVP